MRTLLSIIALAGVAAGIAISSGLFGTVDTAVSELVITGASLPALFGVTPLSVSFAMGRVAAFFSLLVGSLVGVHVAGKVGGPEVLWHLVAGAGVLLGVIGRMPAKTLPPPPVAGIAP